MTITLTRRSLVASIGAVLAASPELAWAAVGRRRPRASRVLVLNLSGGVRSSAAFVASKKKELNPWGRMADVSLPLGNVLALGEPERSIYLSSPHIEVPRRYRSREQPREDAVRLPALKEIANAFSVIGTWDPGRGDHLRSEKVAHTGDTSEEAAGVLVRIFGALIGGAERSGPRLPAFEIGEPGSGSFAPRGMESGTTVSVVGPGQLPRRDEGETEDSRMTGAGFRPRVSGRDRLDENFLDAMGPAGRVAVRGYTQQRRLAQRLASQLTDPIVRWSGGFDGNAARGELELGATARMPLTNGLVQQILGSAGPYAGEEQGGGGDNLLLAFRLLQLGSPAVSVTIPGFDMHSGEREQAPAIYGGLGRTWSALHFLLRHVPDPDVPGATMLDRTLVITNSEFGRDPGQTATGFNGGGGSDHGSHPATFYLGHAVMGAGVVGGRVLGGVDTDTYDARRSRERHTPTDLLATILFALGIEADGHRWGFADARPMSRLWRAT